MFTGATTVSALTSRYDTLCVPKTSRSDFSSIHRGFAQAQDPVEWDAFRTAIHESQGWTLQRLWPPHFFRDPAGCLALIQKEADRVAASNRDPDHDGIGV